MRTETIGRAGDTVKPWQTREVNILEFQEGREAAIRGDKRDARRTRCWLTGYDQETPKPVQPDFLKEERA